MANFYKKSLSNGEKAGGAPAPDGEKNFGTRKEKSGVEVIVAKERKVDISRLVRGKKKSYQSGRSMIEMLGVLAIIGVLSIGSIAAYSKAMLSYRLNRQSEQLNDVMIAIEKIGNSFLNLSETTILTPYFAQLNEIPSEMIRPDDPLHIKDVFGLRWLIYFYPGGKNISLTVYSDRFLPDAGYDLAICNNVIRVVQAHSANVRSVSTLSGYKTDNQIFNKLYGDKYCDSSKKCLRNMTLDDIRWLCSKHTRRDTEFKIVF